jgi:hypothetical protein
MNDMRRQVLIIVVIASLTMGCSTRPREFRAQLAAPTTDEQKFEQDMRLCQVMVRRGFQSNFKAAAAQVLMGTGGGVVAGSVAGSFGTTLSSAIGLGSGALVVAGPLIGFGVSRAIRSGREKKYKAALTTCLSEYGYAVATWEKQKRLTKAEIAGALGAVAPVAPGDTVAPDGAQP